MRRRLFLSTFLALTTSLLLTFGALAQTTQPASPSDDEVNSVAKQLYCPVCENIPLDVCGTQACAQWRELIREKLAVGWEEQQIKDYFAAQYGDRVLATPPTRGLNWLVYLVPPAAIALGIVILIRAMSAWKPKAPASQAAQPAEQPGDPYIARLEEELRSRE
jgi:cytochrome c-type biogenesis protein CcmH